MESKILSKKEIHMMKSKNLIRNMLIAFFIIAITTNEGYAQSVGIGTTTPNISSALEITSPGNNKGLLIPSVALLSIDDKTTIDKLAHRLLAYNTTDDKKIFFYGPSGLLL
jgi:hypothetical protein